MCFCAEASFGVAVGLVPAGVYCVDAAWRKDHRYLLLAAMPLLFGFQQVAEGAVWVGLARGNHSMIQASSLSYLFFALAVWPVWVPLAVARIEGPGWRQRTMVALGVLGVLFGALYYLPLVWGGMLDPTVVGHSIHYDFSALPATDLVQQWVWPVLYLGSVAAPLLVSRDHRLRVLGIGAILSAALTFAAFEYAFASVWCFFAAALSGFITFVMIRLPCPTVGIADTNPPLLPTH